MFLAAINYNNSLAYLLTFLLTSIAIVSMLHCHRNLQGLQLRVAVPQASFAKQPLSFPIYLDNPSARARLSIKLGWPKQAPLCSDLDAGGGQWPHCPHPRDGGLHPVRCVLRLGAARLPGDRRR